MENLISLLANSTMLYIDPAATSVLISSLAAVAVAIGASAIIIWRKLKKGVNKTLHIDPNAKKEVEEELVIKDDSVVNEVAENTSVEVTPIEEVKEEKVEEKSKANEEPKPEDK